MPRSKSTIELAIEQTQERVILLRNELSKNTEVLAALRTAARIDGSRVEDLDLGEDAPKTRVARKSKSKSKVMAQAFDKSRSWQAILAKVLSKGPMPRKELQEIILAERGEGTPGSAVQAVIYGLRNKTLSYADDGKVQLRPE